jgi:copper homeostasis protein
MLLEVCVDSVESACAAQDGGAARVELCANLDVGGTSPERSMVRSVRDHIAIALHVMIRPRGGDFCYSDHEFNLMLQEVDDIKALGVNGVVFGILDRMGNVDVERSRRILESARPMSVTFHRAFDECPDLLRGLEDLKSIGIDRVLTSGGRSPILRNVDLLRKLVLHSSGAVRVMAGGGVNLENVPEIVKRSGVREVHTLSAVLRDELAVGDTAGKVVDPEKVRNMVRLLQTLSSHSQS